MDWQPIETAPKDRPIIAWVNHEANEYHLGDGSLTTYSAHVETFGRAENGMQVVVWGGKYDGCDGYIPDWWFKDHTDFEQAVNPTHWLDIKPPAGAA